jgi:hypothetical protein
VKLTPRQLHRLYCTIAKRMGQHGPGEFCGACDAQIGYCRKYNMLLVPFAQLPAPAKKALEEMVCCLPRTAGLKEIR